MSKASKVKDLLDLCMDMRMETCFEYDMDCTICPFQRETYAGKKVCDALQDLVDNNRR